MYQGSEDIHKLMLADRYREEQDYIRGEGIITSRSKGNTNLAVETNAGVGNLTKLYKDNFSKVLTNDINPKSIAQHNLDSLEFVSKIVNNLPDKIDLIDLDAYRCPVPEVKQYFNRIQNDVPVVICISDGLGLWMKRNSDVQKIIDRYLLDDFEGLDKRHPWRQHIEFWNHLLTKLCKQNNLNLQQIAVMQTKGKNYILGSYLITK